jgi:hypothetical protein
MAAPTRSGTPARDASLWPWIDRVGGFLVSLAALALAARVWRVCRATRTLPMWDEAEHGLAGARVADAIRHVNPVAFLLALNDQVVWPFVHSLLLAPAMLVGRDGLAAGEATSVALEAGAVLLLYMAGRELHPTRGAWIGALAAACALMAPAWGAFGTLVMLEVPGAFLLLVAFVLHVRSAREPLDGGALRWAGMAATALFLLKYNYGLLWLVPVAIWEWSLWPAPSRARTIAALRARSSPAWWMRPAPLALAAGALAIAAILVTGGGVFTFFGRVVSVRSPGNLAYAWWLAALAWLLIPRRVGARDARGAGAGAGAGLRRESRAAWVWARLPERARLLTQTIVVPLAIWFTLPWPNRVREFLGFITNRDSGAPFWTESGLLFYPRALATDYAPAPWLGAAALALALGAVFVRRPGSALRLARLAFLVGIGLTVIHRFRDPRFLFTVTPLVWLCAAAVLVALLDALLARIPSARVRETIALAGLIATIAGAWLTTPGFERINERRLRYRTPATIAPALDSLLAVTAEAERTTPVDRIALLGYSNVLSPGLLKWHTRLTPPPKPVDRLPLRVPTLEAQASEDEMTGRLAWLSTQSDLVIAALADSSASWASRDYLDEVWADRETAVRLERDPEHWLPGRAFAVAGFEIHSYRARRP